MVSKRFRLNEKRDKIYDTDNNTEYELMEIVGLLNDYDGNVNAQALVIGEYQQRCDKIFSEKLSVEQGNRSLKNTVNEMRNYIEKLKYDIRETRQLLKYRENELNRFIQLRIDLDKVDRTIEDKYYRTVAIIYRE